MKNHLTHIHQSQWIETDSNLSFGCDRCTLIGTYMSSQTARVNGVFFRCTMPGCSKVSADRPSTPVLPAFSSYLGTRLLLVFHSTERLYCQSHIFNPNRIDLRFAVLWECGVTRLPLFFRVFRIWQLRFIDEIWLDKKHYFPLVIFLGCSSELFDSYCLHSIWIYTLI